MRTPEFLRIHEGPLTPEPVRYERLGFSWGAVIAGVAVATALTVWFAEVGLALNLGIIDRNSDASTVTIVNAVLWVVTGLIAVFAGAWVAGRMSNARSAMSGGLHGVGVWAASSVVALMLAFMTVGALAGGMLSLVGSTVAGVGGAVATGVGESVGQMAPDWESVRAQLSEAQDEIAGPDASVGETVDAVAEETRFLDESRLMELAGQHFSLEGSQLAQEERAEFVGLIAKRLDISPEVAERTLAQWDRVWASGVERYETAKAEALEIADQTRDVAMAAAGWAALAMLLGLIVSALGGAYGAACRSRALENEYVLQARAAPSTMVTEAAALRRAEEEPLGSSAPTRTVTRTTTGDSTRRR